MLGSAQPHAAWRSMVSHLSSALNSCAELLPIEISDPQPCNAFADFHCLRDIRLGGLTAALSPIATLLGVAFRPQRVCGLQEHILYPQVVAALVDGRISWREDGVPILWDAN